MAARRVCGPGLTTALAGAGEPEMVCGHFRPQDSGRTSLHGGARGTARGWGCNAAAGALQPREEHTAHPPLQTPAKSLTPPPTAQGGVAGAWLAPCRDLTRAWATSPPGAGGTALSSQVKD